MGYKSVKFCDYCKENRSDTQQFKFWWEHGGRDYNNKLCGDDYKVVDVCTSCLTNLAQRMLKALPHTSQKDIATEYFPTAKVV